MLPNLLEATQEYWQELNKLEIAYQQGEITIEEVDREVSYLMAELGQKRRATFSYFFKSWQRQLRQQKENLIGLAILIIITYAWVSVNLSI